MNIYARMAGGAVAELIPVAPDLRIGIDVIHPNIAQNLVDVTAVAGIAEGWTLGASGWAAPIKAAPDTATLARYAKAKQTAVLVAGSHFNVAADGQPTLSILSDGTPGTLADLAALDRFGEGNAAGTRTWLDNNGMATPLTGAQFVALFALVSAWSSASYATLGEVLAKITSGAITTTAEIDSAAWPAIA